MHTVGVASEPLSDVISNLAAAFNTTSETNRGEQLLFLPPQFGTGSITSIVFDGGLKIIRFQCSFNEDTEIRFNAIKNPPLRFLYLNKGRLYHRFCNETEVNTVNRFQNVIVGNSSHDGHVFGFKRGIRTDIYSLEMDRSLFSEKCNFVYEEVDPKFLDLFDAEKTQQSFYYEGGYSLRMADIIEKIEEFKGCGLLYRIFMEGIAYQTLLEQLSQFLDDQRVDKNRPMLRRNEIASISVAVAYINDHLATYKSVPTLMKITGLNASKLQEGFKYLYNKTVNQYVHDARMDLAKDLLLNTDVNISEIVYRIGLSSKSYFSRVFKEEYGVSPSTFRQKKYRK